MMVGPAFARIPENEMSSHHIMTADLVPNRPQVAFAMASNELRDRLFGPAARQRLGAVADVVNEDVLTEFDSPAARSVLARTTALITGWGSPRIDAEVLEASPALALIAHAAGTVKAHVTEECWDRGITVTTAAQANGIPVAEYTLAYILLAGKDAAGAQQKLRAQRSGYVPDMIAPGLGNAGGTIGIIGASRIGRLVLELLKPFSFEVLLCDPTITAVEAAGMGVQLVSLAELMTRSKVVSLHAPVLPSTVGMIGNKELSLMPAGATFINTARGVLVDHDALRAELLAGRINAVLDVTAPEPLLDDDPLYELPNVTLTPHIAGSLGNELARIGDLAVEEVVRLASGGTPEFAVTRQALLDMA